MPLSDSEQDARERVAGAEAGEEDVAGLGALGVGGGEEAGAGAGWVEGGELGGGDGCDGVGAGFCGGAGGRDDGDLFHAFFSTCSQALVAQFGEGMGLCAYGSA